MAHERRKLSDILNGASAQFTRAWESTEAAGDDKPIPRGEYVCHAIKGEPFKSPKKGTPSYKVTFQVIEGAHTGRLVWLDLWLTDAAMPRSKRDLAKLRITDPQQMEQPLPQGIRCKVAVVVTADDGSIERNEVRRFEVVGVDGAEPNPYAPESEAGGGDGDREGHGLPV